jgi:dCTP deaminase
VFLSRVSIQTLANNTESPLFDDNTYSEASLQQASYDLRLGCEYFVVGDDVPQKLTRRNPYIVLRPGQFAFLSTLEKVHLPFDVIGLITLRNRFKRQGLVNISGFHVDPTYRGVLIFAVQNIGPSDLRLKFEEPVFTMFLAKTDAKHKEDAGAARPASFDGISLELVQNLGGSTVTLARLQKEIQDLRTQLLIYAPFVLAALIPLLLEIISRWHDKH